MRIRNILIPAALLVAAAATGFAQLSQNRVDWGKGPVQFLMTPEEKAQWSAIKTDADADLFIALFWARRDPTPGTPRNEFREEFEARAQYADQHFAGPRTLGSLTDRGKVLILFGPPTRVVRSGGQGKSTITPPMTEPGTSLPAEAADTENSEKQVWMYEDDRARKAFNAPKVDLRFIDRLNNGDMRMETPRIDFAAAQQRVVTAAITQPNLANVPSREQPAAPPVPATPVATTLKTPLFETAVSDAKGGKATNKGATVSYAEFVSPAGEYYVPLSLYVPAASGVTAEMADTLFGVIEDAAGKRVLAFEEPVKLTVSKSDLFTDKTLELPSGKYTAIVGLAKGSAPVLVASAPLELHALSKEATGISSLILSNNIHELEKPASIKTPFAFGQLKIVPTTNFTNKDELGYFVEIHNPGIAEVPTGAVETVTKPTSPTTSESGSKAQTVLAGPKLQMKMELLDAKGQIVANSPLADVDARSLSGQPGPGQYAIVNGIPLSQLSTPLPAGEYRLRMKIVDTVTKQSYNLEQKFRITA